MNSHRPHFPVAADAIRYHAASGVVTNKQGQILLFLRDDMSLWTNIGGNVDPGEDFKAALHREAREETGCDIIIDRFVGDFFSPQKSGGYYHEQVYMCRIADGQSPSPQPNEGVTLRWFAPNDLPTNMSPRFRTRILQAFAENAEPVALITHGDNMVEFLKNCTDFSQFVGLDEWNQHPTAQYKRAHGLLKFDPFSNRH